MADIFLSYAREDREKAEAICAGLEQREHHCWIAPRDVPPGATYAEAILDAIESSKVLVLLLSSQANLSRHVRQEVERAFNKGVRILPVRVEQVEPERSLEYFISSAQWLDAWDPPLELHLKRLSESLRVQVGPPLEPPAPTGDEAEQPPAGRDEAAPYGGVGESAEDRLPTSGPPDDAPTIQRPTMEEIRRYDPKVLSVEIAAVGASAPPRTLDTYDWFQVLFFWARNRWRWLVGAGLVVALLFFSWCGWRERRSEASLEEPEAARITNAARAEGAPPTRAEDEALNRRILIEGGEFLMGSPEEFGEEDEHPQHRVRLSSFYLQEHEVTNEEYRRFKPDHRFPKGEERNPAVKVSWKEAAAYSEWLGGRLPTEAEWEYACRAGTQTVYSSGDRKEDQERVGWYSANSGLREHPVGELEPNPWGLHDMHGNVWEWVADWYGPYPEGSQVDPLNTEPSSGGRVIRGGSFLEPAGNARSANRDRYKPGARHGALGFRVVLPA